MTTALDPRTTPIGSWKTWLRDGAHLFNRAFFPWGGLSLALVLVLLAGLLNSLSQEGRVGLWLAMFFFSDFYFAFQQCVLTHSAENTPTIAFWSHLQVHVFYHARVGLIRIITVLLLAQLLVFIQKAIHHSPLPDTSHLPAPDLWALTWSYGLWMYLVPLFGRIGACLGMSYWLRGLCGLPRAEGHALEGLALKRNKINIQTTNLLLMMLVLLSILIDYALPLLLPLTAALSWYIAAVNRCAFHDIFIGGTGIKAKVPKAVLEHRIAIA